MTSIRGLARRLQPVLTTRADAIAEATGCVQRRRVFTSSTLVQSLVFGWLARPDATLEELAQTATSVGAPVSPQAMAQRFTEPLTDCLATVLAEAIQSVVVAADPVAIPLLARFRGVDVLDSTTIRLPDALAA